MNLVITALLAAVAGFGWNLATGNQPMSYWLMGCFFIGSCLGAELIEHAWDRRRTRRRSAHRAAVVRSWTSIRRRKTPSPVSQGLVHDLQTPTSHPSEGEA